MRAPRPLFIITALAFMAIANAQTAPPPRTAAAQRVVAMPAATARAAADTAATEPSTIGPAVSRPAFAAPVAGQPVTQPTFDTAHERVTAHDPRPSHSRQSPAPPTGGIARASSRAADSTGVLDLGATDITGNKELPKVMVIVPWKDSLGAGGVVKPTDSLLDEMLQPVDRSVFQRRIRYYGQLEPTEVAPVGDSH